MVGEGEGGDIGVQICFKNGVNNVIRHKIIRRAKRKKVQIL